MSVEEKLKQYIEDNGIKIAFIAEKAEVNENLLGKSLNGKRVLKSFEFVRICKVLKLDLDYFATDPLQPTG